VRVDEAGIALGPAQGFTTRPGVEVAGFHLRALLRPRLVRDADALELGMGLRRRGKPPGAQGDAGGAGDDEAGAQRNENRSPHADLQ
jgi:hypothetical protein